VLVEGNTIRVFFQGQGAGPCDPEAPPCIRDRAVYFPIAPVYKR
jgi:hypothetical protein